MLEPPVTKSRQSPPPVSLHRRMIRALPIAVLQAAERAQSKQFTAHAVQPAGAVSPGMEQEPACQGLCNSMHYGLTRTIQALRQDRPRSSYPRPEFIAPTRLVHNPARGDT